MMRLEQGEEITWRLLDDHFSYRAKVIEENENSLTITTESTEESGDLSGRFALIITQSGDIYAKVQKLSGDRVFFSKLLGDRRSYFRVDDVFPVIAAPVKGSQSVPARILTFNALRVSIPEMPSLDNTDDSLSAALSVINNKLDFLITSLVVQREGLTTAVPLQVNLSASGIKLPLDEKVSPGDILELKMLLPSCPPVALVVCGKVIRVKEIRENNDTRYETSLSFRNMTDDVKEEIIQYTLKRQREIIRQLRELG
jgi:hypothetical protein